MTAKAPIPEIETTMPLAGMRVLDLMTGPMAAVSRYYAELGADVIKVEPEGGGEDRHEGRIVCGVSLDFIANNIGKRAATDRHLLQLAAGADLLIAPRGAINADEVRTCNPGLVLLSISDFGSTGRFSGWNGSEAIFYALSGELSRSGIPDREPLLPPSDLGYACAAGQAAFLGLTAYWQAVRSGVGDHLDFSILDGIAQVLDPGYGIGGSATAGVPASQLPRGRPEARFQYPIFPCKDGFVRLCVLAPRQWQGLFRWMGEPQEFADPSYDHLQARFTSTTLLPAISRLLVDKTRFEIEREGILYGVPVAAVLELAETLATDHMQARRAFVPVEVSPGLSVLFPDGVMEIDGARMGVSGPVPDTPVDEIDWRPREFAPIGSHNVSQPFDGLRVLDFGVIVVGAESGRLLGDRGADVVKVESSAFPDGSRTTLVPAPISVGFATGQRNKRSLGLNLRESKGKEMIRELIRETDVLLANFKGGTLEALGLDYQSLKAINPGLIVCDSSAFGASGPDFRRMGYGPLVRAVCGLTMLWRYPGEPDSFSDAITIYPDHVAARVGLIGVLALLIRRLRTGVGGQINISQGEVILSQMAAHVAADSISRAGRKVEDRRPSSAVYRAGGDDDWCVVTMRSERDAQTVRNVTGGSSLDDWLAERSSKDAMEALQSAGVAAGSMLRVSELPTFDYYLERGSFRTADHPLLKDPLTVENIQVQSERSITTLQRPAPAPGEHTSEILRERLDLNDEDIASLIKAGVLEQYV